MTKQTGERIFYIALGVGGLALICIAVWALRSMLLAP